MKIEPVDSNETGAKRFFRFMRRSVFKRKVVIPAFLLLFCIACYVASGKVKQVGFSGLWDFVSTVSHNYFIGRKAQPENISLEIKDKDFKILEQNRAQALQRGVIINDIDGDYVPATFEYEGKKMQVKLRLKGHMTDHLQDNKWSFRIKVKDKDSFMGMKRFSIQHPGTRGYIYEWIYHELMKHEDVIALRYKFVNVTVNGRDWGIYAVEENFEDELIANNKRPRGPILRYNPDLYWASRYNVMTGQASNDEFASYYSANPEAYRENKVLSDSTQKMYYEKAVALMEGLRERKITVDQAFDIPRMAKFHAIIDLVGGTHSIDWSDIKYYYNPVTSKLEPVAYESFTDLGSHDLSALYKFVQPDSSQNYADWHTMIFSNEVFFKAYMQELEKVTKPAYLDAFFNESNSELNKNLAIIYKEFPYKKFNYKEYYKRAAIIHKVLDPPKAIHAYFEKFENGNAYVQVGALDALPVQIKSISINDESANVWKNNILPAKQVNEYVNFRELIVHMPDYFKWKDDFVDSAKITYSILGSEETKEVKVFPFPHTDSEFISKAIREREPNVDKFDFILHSNKEGQSYAFKPGKIVIKEDIVIPANSALFLNEGTSLDFINNARLISFSPLIFTGSEEEPVMIGSSDSTSEGIEVINAAKSVFKYVTFTNLPKVHDEEWARSGALTFYESPVEFTNCSFYDSKAEDAINLIRSEFFFKECLFHKMHDDALDADFSTGKVVNCVFENCHENAMDLTMCNVIVRSLYVNNAGNKAFNIKAGTQFSGSDIRIVKAHIGISAEDLSAIDLQLVKISESEMGVIAYKNKPSAGHPIVKLNGLSFTNVQKMYLKEKKSTIIANGVTIGDGVGDVEAIIKSDKKKKHK